MEPRGSTDASVVSSVVSAREVAAAEIMEALGIIGTLEGALVVGDQLAARRAVETLRMTLSAWGRREAQADACWDASVPGAE